MTKGDYQLIATVVRALPPVCRGVATESFIVKLQADNPRFDPETFRKACES